MLRAMKKHAIVKRDEPVVGTIINPNAAKPCVGTVIDVNDVPNVKVGDGVVWSKHAGTEIVVNGEAVLVLKADEILGTINE